MGKIFAACMLVLSAGALLAEEVTIAAFGDSLVQGYGLALEDGFVAQLQTWLDDQDAQAKVVNAGVSGDTTAGGRARIAWTLTPDVEALILVLGGNDFLRGLPPEASRANLEAIVQATQAAGIPVLLIGMKAPPNFGPAYKAAFDAIFPDLSQEYTTLYVEDFFAGLGVESPSAARSYMQPDGIHPNAEGVNMIAAAIGPAVLELVAQARQK